MSERILTEKQKTFLECLFLEGIDGNFVAAKRAAGYSDESATSDIVKSLKEEILEATRLYLASQGPKAAIKLSGVLDDPTALGNQAVLSASKDILDRVGIVKTEKVETTHKGIFLLPPKKEYDGE